MVRSTAFANHPHNQLAMRRRIMLAHVNLAYDIYPSVLFVDANAVAIDENAGGDVGINGDEGLP